MPNTGIKKIVLGILGFVALMLYACYFPNINKQWAAEITVPATLQIVHWACYVLFAVIGGNVAEWFFKLKNGAKKQ